MKNTIPQEELCPLCEKEILINGVCKKCTELLCKPISENKQETLEEAPKFAERKYLERLDNFQKVDFKDGVMEGAKWQQEQNRNKYNEEDMYEYAIYYKNSLINTPLNILDPKKWFEQFKNK